MEGQAPTNPARDAEAEEPPAKSDCLAVGRVLDRIGDKWTVMVVGVLSKGPLRFNAMMRAIDGVSHRMLTRTLRSLERDGLVNRAVYPTVPPKVEYELTEVGHSLIKPLRALLGWAREHRPVIESSRRDYDRSDDRA
ncbi:MAG: helix-turn-helix transcriptional regulator [Bauldia sp.]|nr:helix-turn-helix transcriptional regulator [Bauldia sp.]